MREVESLRLVEKGGEGCGEVGPEGRELGLRLEEFRLVRAFRRLCLLCLGLLNFFDRLVVLFRLASELSLCRVPAGPVAFGQTGAERVVDLFREFVGPELVGGGGLCEFVLERDAQPGPRRTELLIRRLAVHVEGFKLFRERVLVVCRVQALLQAAEGTDVGEFELGAFVQELGKVGGEGSFEREAELDGVERGCWVARLQEGVGVQRHRVGWGAVVSTWKLRRGIRTAREREKGDEIRALSCLACTQTRSESNSSRESEGRRQLEGRTRRAVRRHRRALSLSLSPAPHSLPCTTWTAREDKSCATLLSLVLPPLACLPLAYLR